MRCSRCSKKAVFRSPDLCREHFISYVEDKAADTLKKYRLITPKDKVVVAASGGKDSIACLYILSKHHRNLTALAIDEGIAGYREHTLSDLKRFCKEGKIKLVIKSVKEEFGKSLDGMLEAGKDKPCTVCGAIRRFMINKYARKLRATKLATGHNLDDEAQSVLMNIYKNQLEISARLGPVTGIIRDRRFIRRIKPLYFLSEKEIMAYAFLKDFGIRFSECPYAHDSYRGEVQRQINELEKTFPGIKRNIIDHFLETLPLLRKHFATDEKPNACRICGEPARQEICTVCRLIGKMKGR